MSFDAFQDHKVQCNGQRVQDGEENSACHLDKYNNNECTTPTDAEGSDACDSTGATRVAISPDTTGAETSDMRVDLPSSETGSFSCPHCSLHYDNQSTLDTHVKVVHTDTDKCPYKCTGCQGGFMTNADLDNHLELCKRFASDNSSFKCPECWTPFEFKSLLDFHMTIHMNPELRPYRCTGCRGGFAALTHKVSHEEKCGKFKRLKKENDEELAEVKHPTVNGVRKMVDPVQMEITAPEGKPFQCKLCSDEFLFFCQFEDHIRSCNLKVNEKESSSTTVDLKDGKSCREILNSLDYTASIVLCPICRIDLKPPNDNCLSSVKTKASRHMMGHDTCFKRYICPGCGWGSASPSRKVFLNHAHLCQPLKEKFPEIAFDDAHVRCPMCLVQFSSCDECEDHVTTCHTGSSKEAGNPYTCFGCKAHYDNEQQLRSHLQQCIVYARTEKQETLCGVCLSLFSRTDSYDTHYVEFHLLLANNICCSFCKISFSSIRDLIVHVNCQCAIARSVILESKDLPGKIVLPEEILSNVKGSKVGKSNSSIDLATCSVNEDVKVNTVSYNTAEIDWDQMAKQKECGICGATTIVEYKARRHMKIHTDSANRPLHCRRCGGGFFKTTGLAAHEETCIRKNIPLKLFKIVKQTVPLESADRESVNPPSVEQLNSDGQNDQCQSSQLTPKSSTPEPQISEAEITEQPYPETTTDMGNYLETSAAELDPEMDTPTNIEVAIDYEDEERTVLRCDRCAVTFPTDSEMASHIISVHGPPENKCEICEREFKYAESLTEHRMHCGKDLQVKQTAGDDEEVSGYVGVYVWRSEDELIGYVGLCV